MTNSLILMFYIIDLHTKVYTVTLFINFCLFVINAKHCYKYKFQNHTLKNQNSSRSNFKLYFIFFLLLVKFSQLIICD